MQMCEALHSGESWFSEPLNVLSSALFLVTAFALHYYFRKSQNRHPSAPRYFDLDIRLLIGVIYAIGVSSLLLHSIPNSVTEFFDVISISLFIIVFFFSVMLRILRCSTRNIILAFLGFCFFTFSSITYMQSYMNGATSYISTMAALTMVAFYLYGKNHPSAKHFLAAGQIGIVALYFRSIDTKMCDFMPIGTHWIWHVMNAVLITIIMRELIKRATKRPIENVVSFSAFVAFLRKNGHIAPRKKEKVTVVL